MISILMSTYNGEHFLPAQLDSILAQTCSDWHLTIRDDGSSDATRTVIADYCARYPERISQIVDSDNLRALRSFERLLQQSPRADYYMFADQDDVWLPEKIEKTLACMLAAEKEHPGVPLVVHTDLVVVDEDLQEMSPSFWRYSNIRPSIIDGNIHYQCICNSVTGCTMLFNNAARDCSLPMPAQVFMHDAWIATAALLNGGVLCPLAEPQMLYRQHRRNVVGAVAYRFTLTNLKYKKMLADRAYNSAHPMVWRNRLHFLWWKTKYFFILHFTKE